MNKTFHPASQVQAEVAQNSECFERSLLWRIQVVSYFFSVTQKKIRYFFMIAQMHLVLQWRNPDGNCERLSKNVNISQVVFIQSFQQYSEPRAGNLNAVSEISDQQTETRLVSQGLYWALRQELDILSVCVQSSWWRPRVSRQRAGDFNQTFFFLLLLLLVWNVSLLYVRPVEVHVCCHMMSTEFKSGWIGMFLNSALAIHHGRSIWSWCLLFFLLFF